MAVQTPAIRYSPLPRGGGEHHARRSPGHERFFGLVFQDDVGQPAGQRGVGAGEADSGGLTDGAAGSVAPHHPAGVQCHVPAVGPDDELDALVVLRERDQLLPAPHLGSQRRGVLFQELLGVELVQRQGERVDGSHMTEVQPGAGGTEVSGGHRRPALDETLGDAARGEGVQRAGLHADGA